MFSNLCMEPKIDHNGVLLAITIKVLSHEGKISSAGRKGSNKWIFIYLFIYIFCFHRMLKALKVKVASINLGGGAFRFR
jgi:hypothetical protein